MSSPLSREKVLFDVVVEEHEIVKRNLGGAPTGEPYRVPRTERRLGVSTKMSDRLARLYVKKVTLEDAHRRAGVPPWRPYLRESWPRVSATEYRSEW